MWKFKKLDIAIPFHQYPNSFEKHFCREKFSPGTFSACSQLAEHSRPCLQLYYFDSRRINVMFNKRVAVFLWGLKSRAELDRYGIRHARKSTRV